MLKGTKVYGWTAVVTSKATREALGMPAHRIQARAIVAARSKAAVARIVGVKYPHELFCLGETGNAKEIALAQTSPGQVFASSMDGPSRYLAIEATAVK